MSFMVVKSVCVCGTSGQFVWQFTSCSDEVDNSGCVILRLAWPCDADLTADSGTVLGHNTHIVLAGC